MKTQIGRLIKPDGTETTLYPKNGRKFDLSELQTAVQGYIERVDLIPGNGHVTAYINEEGKLQNLAPNPKATALTVAGLHYGDTIVGNMLIVSRDKGEDKLSALSDKLDETS